jgi:hypothetical protein
MLLSRAETLRAHTSDALMASPKALKAARDAYDTAVAEAVAEQLAEMPVARLKDTTEGRVRIDAVEDAGFRTVHAVLRAGRYRLEQIRGVGPETATKTFAAARQLRHAVTESVRLRLDIERRPHSHTTLLTALATWHAVESRIGSARDELDALAPRLDELLEAAAPARSRMGLLFSSRKRRAAAKVALNELGLLMGTDRAAELAEMSEAVLAIEPATPAAVWDEYGNDAVAFNGLLIEVGGLGPDEEQVHGRLPRELVDRISQHPLDTSRLKVALRGYQAFGARFALTQRRSIVGDEMGLGKTIEALAEICHVAARAAVTSWWSVRPACWSTGTTKSETAPSSTVSVSTEHSATIRRNYGRAAAALRSRPTVHSRRCLTSAATSTCLWSTRPTTSRIPPRSALRSSEVGSHVPTARCISRAHRWRTALRSSERSSAISSRRWPTVFGPSMGSPGRTRSAERLRRSTCVATSPMCSTSCRRGSRRRSGWALGPMTSTRTAPRWHLGTLWPCAAPPTCPARSLARPSSHASGTSSKRRS